MNQLRLSLSLGFLSIGETSHNYRMRQFDWQMATPQVPLDQNRERMRNVRDSGPYIDVLGRLMGPAKKYERRQYGHTYALPAAADQPEPGGGRRRQHPHGACRQTCGGGGPPDFGVCCAWLAKLVCVERCADCSVSGGWLVALASVCREDLLGSGDPICRIFTLAFLSGAIYTRSPLYESTATWRWRCWGGDPTRGARGGAGAQL